MKCWPMLPNGRFATTVPNRHCPFAFRNAQKYRLIADSTCCSLRSRTRIFSGHVSRVGDDPSVRNAAAAHEESQDAPTIWFQKALHARGIHARQEAGGLVVWAATPPSGFNIASSIDQGRPLTASAELSPRQVRMSMSRNSRAWLPALLRPELLGAAPSDWSLRSLDAFERLVPARVMALFPDLRAWLLRLRAIRREALAGDPIFAVEKLSGLPQPLQSDEDRDVLVGAVLTLSTSLYASLDMLRDLLPQDKSCDRLGEILCPTLGQLLSSLQSTLSSFEQHLCQSTKTPTDRTAPSCRRSQNPQKAPAPLSTDPAPHPSGPEPPGSSTCSTSRPDSSRAETHHRKASGLIRAIHAEMRVQAAIHVAVESLEFAERQLKLVKDLHALNGGSTSSLQEASLDPHATSS